MDNLVGETGPVNSEVISEVPLESPRSALINRLPYRASLGWTHRQEAFLDPVQAQYEHLPYPHRDPADEAHRLQTTTPSELVEIDHYLFRGRRDWSRPFRALAAGGGTGDATINMAQRLADIGCPAEVHYLDMSKASRRVAEARAAARGLDNITFHTGDLLTAGQYGPFDYIDCCGVLHHLPDPLAGFQALAGALAPDGGIGLMVYAPHGRSGVYPVQAALRTLLDGIDAVPERLRIARSVMAASPDSNLLKRNPFLTGWQVDDAEFYDLLVHARDRAYSIRELADVMTGAGLDMVAPAFSALYDLGTILPAEAQSLAAGLDRIDRLALAEQLRGDISRHIVYAKRAGMAGDAMAVPSDAAAVPHLRGFETEALAREVADRGCAQARLGAIGLTLALPRESALAIAVIGERPLGEMAQILGLDWMRFQSIWAPVDKALGGINALFYSRGARCAPWTPTRTADQRDVA